ncbi:hypothetical protein [Dapis sp. BLCC M229]|uniref:hypothetical protein n=1 Tax=Dapis sp. BLCC M229 TaxID=3400188 RepID=UPI003CF24A8E
MDASENENSSRFSDVGFDFSDRLQHFSLIADHKVGTLHPKSLALHKCGIILIVLWNGHLARS